MNVKIIFKKRILFLGSRVSLGVLVTYGVLIFTLLTVAAATFFSAVANPVSNSFTFADDSDVNVYIVDELGQKPAPDGVVLWGANTKYVALQLGADGFEVDAYVRVMLVPVVYNADGSVAAVNMGDITVPPSSTASTWQLGDLTIYLNANWSSYWNFSDDFFYYNNPLSRGQTTLNLFQGATLDNSSGNYDGKTFTIEVLADAIDVADASEWGLSVP